MRQDLFELLVDMFDTQVRLRGITFPEEYVRGLAFDDFVQQFYESNEMPCIKIFDGMTCERDMDWLLQQVKS